jgi:hypothetical protein
MTRWLLEQRRDLAESHENPCLAPMKTFRIAPSVPAKVGAAHLLNSVCRCVLTRNWIFDAQEEWADNEFARELLLSMLSMPSYWVSRSTEDQGFQTGAGGAMESAGYQLEDEERLVEVRANVTYYSWIFPQTIYPANSFKCIVD